MPKDASFKLRVLISVLALGAAVLHLLLPGVLDDPLTLGLLILAILPWLAPVIKSIEIAGIGKLELAVESVKESQELLQEEVDALRFLVSGFVTDWELKHLERLATEDTCYFERGADRDDRFINEIIRLRDFGLVAKRIDYALYDIPTQGNLKDYVELTNRGRLYLALRQQIDSSAKQLAKEP